MRQSRTRQNGTKQYKKIIRVQSKMPAEGAVEKGLSRAFCWRPTQQAAAAGASSLISASLSCLLPATC